MTPEQEAELVEKMAREIYESVRPKGSFDAVKAEREADGLDFPPAHMCPSFIAARAALRIAKPVIRDEALEDASDNLIIEAQREGSDDTAYTLRSAAAFVSALKSKGQKPS
jgi:hypothetical protein